MAMVTMLWSTVAFADVAPSTWGAVKGLYRGEEAVQKGISVPGPAPAWQTPADAAWWRSLSQAARNQAIVERAYQNLGQNVGMNCKEWARWVVRDASRGTVNLPPTLPTDSGWYFGYSPYLVGMSGGIRSVASGWIVQSIWHLYSNRTHAWYNTPHTMIVLGRGGDGVYVIECNWVAAGTVGARWITFSEFDSKVIAHSSYYVTGG